MIRTILVVLFVLFGIFKIYNIFTRSDLAPQVQTQTETIEVHGVIVIEGE